MTQTFYKLRHIPTGRYFKPLKGIGRSQLSREGKVYSQMPTLNWLGDAFYETSKKLTEVRAEDWEIDVYEAERTKIFFFPKEAPQ